jgi:AcrR family transcriptional regulator
MSEPRRLRLLTAATELAEKHRLDQLTIDAIAAGAGLTKTDFLAEFDSVDAYLVELHNQFMEHILSSIVKDAGKLPPSLERMGRASAIQLDICLEQRALRGLLAEARRMVPSVADVFHRRNQVTAVMISIELKSLGCTRAAMFGRFYCMMVLEAAQIEADAGKLVAEARSALADFLALSLKNPDA